MSEEAKDEIVFDGKWRFDESVTEVFDDMLERSIPQYQIMRDLTFSLSKTFVKKGTDVVDLGCSRGGSMSRLVNEFGVTCRHVGVEVSQPMLAAVRTKFKNLIDVGVVVIKELDLRREFPIVHASVISSVLTIQFTPIEYRQQIIQNVHDVLVPGGCFVFVEKILGHGAEIDNLFVNAFLGMKNELGYTQEQIERKRMSLEGVLVPATAKWNEELLWVAGFKKVDCFWRCLNFAGWIAIK